MVPVCNVQSKHPVRTGDAVHLVNRTRLTFKNTSKPSKFLYIAHQNTLCL